jgi:hypothetical protein
MFSHLNPDVLVTRSSYEPRYNRNPEVTSVVTERRINPFSLDRDVDEPHEWDIVTISAHRTARTVRRAPGQ